VRRHLKSVPDLPTPEPGGPDDAAVTSASSPYLHFARHEWARLRADTPLTLTEADLEDLSGINEAVSLDEVVEVYLPLSRLLNFYVGATQELYRATAKFLGSDSAKVPYVIGMAGSVAVGKSTTARILQALLSRWPDHPDVGLVTTDGFLWPNAELERRGLMQRKGFPESYDVKRLVDFVARVKSGERHVRYPVYSHLSYDIVPEGWGEIDQPDILIIEGLNVLQPPTVSKEKDRRLFLSDLFDFSIYVDAETEVIEDWYVRRFLTLRKTAFKDPSAYFHRYSKLSREEAEAVAHSIWKNINEVNLVENILPTRDRATFILGKGHDHSVETVKLRKL
jgi:type I pantothenate kinase